MKKVLFVAVAMGAALVMSSCKSQESAYRAAYEKAKAQETTVVTTTPVAVVETPAPAPTVTTTPVQTTTPADVEVRTIKGPYSVIKGAALNTYGIVVGSFTLETNAEGVFNTLKNQGWNPSIVKTSETINGITGWYRVVATSYNDKSQAALTRDQLRSNYSGAWLLYHK